MGDFRPDKASASAVAGWTQLFRDEFMEQVQSAMTRYRGKRDRLLFKQLLTGVLDRGLLPVVQYQQPIDDGPLLLSGEEENPLRWMPVPQLRLYTEKEYLRCLGGEDAHTPRSAQVVEDFHTQLQDLREQVEKLW